MHVFKSVWILVAASFAAAFLISWCVGWFGFGSPVLALLFNWLVVCWVASLSLVVELPFPSAYYAIKVFEASGRMYERIGIRAFRKFVRHGPVRALSPKLRLPKEITAEAVRELEGRMRKAETIHVLAFVVMLIVGGYAAVRVGIGSVWIFMFNLVINVYPILLQRYNRIKLEGLLQKQQARRAVAMA